MPGVARVFNIHCCMSYLYLVFQISNFVSEVTTLFNTSENVACHADNGHGTPHLARRRIKILSAPRITDMKENFFRIEEGSMFQIK